MRSVESLRAASAQLDPGPISVVLHEDVVFKTPALGGLEMSGRRDVMRLFEATFAIFDDIQCRAEIGDEAGMVLVLDCRFGRLRLTDALLVEFAADGRISRLQPHLRPWPASTVFIGLAAVRLCRHPRMIARSMKWRR